MRRNEESRTSGQNTSAPRKAVGAHLVWQKPDGASSWIDKLVMLTVKHTPLCRVEELYSVFPVKLERLGTWAGQTTTTCSDVPVEVLRTSGLGASLGWSMKSTSIL